MQILVRDIFISLAVISVVLFINNKNKDERGIYLYNIGIILFSISIVIIFSLTGISPMSGFHMNIRIAEVSLIPFEGIIQMVQGGITTHAIINIFGNIIMFMPIGFLIPLLWTKLDSLKKIALLGFGTSLFIECTQLFLIRATDIDDLILNTTGAILGYLSYVAFQKLFPVFIEKNIIKSKALENEIVLCFSSSIYKLWRNDTYGRLTSYI